MESIESELWTDVLSDRRHSSDFLWISFHNWNCLQYKYSKNRNSEMIREDVYNEPYIQVLFSIIELLFNYFLINN